jgi:hypothetical protein
MDGNMRWLSIALAGCMLVTGIVAAVYWLKSASVPVNEQGFYRVNDDYHASQMETDEIMRSLRQAATLNKRAAIWTAVSVLLSVASSVTGAWPP